MHHRFPHGFAGNRAGIDAHTAHDIALLYHHHAPPAFGGLDSGALAGGPGPYHDEIEFLHVQSWTAGGAPAVSSPVEPYFAELNRSSISCQFTTFHQAFM